MLEDIRAALKIGPKTPAAEYLNDILAEYKAELKEKGEWASSTKGKSAFVTLANQLSCVARRVLKASAIAKNFGRDWDSAALALHDNLLNFAGQANRLALDVAAKGGPGNLYTRLHGPPEWRLAVVLAALYRSRAATPERDRFMSSVYIPAIQHVTGHSTKGKELSPRIARDAYKFTKKALPIANRIHDVTYTLRCDRKLRAKERKALEQELASLREDWSQIQGEAPYPFLIGRQPGT